ncbi:MAG TPA: hypothetical protein VLK23_12065 [Thermodesulfobacteriota bacterium]|nr:hypothetical protein [Thermodesulfobacteriota bacterium]
MDIRKYLEEKKEIVELALGALGPFGKNAEPLREIGRFIIARNY